jgi:hypothetical protein
MISSSSDTYAHKLTGECRCGRTHGYDFDARPRSEIVARYVYIDEQGQPLHRTIRYKPKRFSQEHYENGKWMTGLAGTRRVLYHLPDVLSHPASDPIFLVEGEKDADALNELGVCATCNPMGAGKWHGSYSEALRGKWIVPIPDNDDAGRQHTEQVCAALWGKAAKITRIDLPGLKEKGDAFDWIRAGGTRAELHRIAVETMEWHPPSRMKGIDATELLQMEFPPDKWVIKNLLGEGVTLLCAPPKYGKSLFALDIALEVVCGGKALGSLDVVEQGEVLFISLDDRRQKAIKQRLQKLLNGRPMPKGFIFYNAWPRLDQGGIEALEHEIAIRPNLRLIVIDTWKHIKPVPIPGLNIYDADVDAMHPLQAAVEGKCALLAVHHTNRRIAPDDPFDLISGSQGLAASVSAAIVMRRARGKSEAKISVTGRDIEEQELACSFDKETLLWTISGDAADAELNSTRNAILEFLKIQLTGRPRDIAAAIGKSVNVVSVTLYRMTRDGQVRALGDGLYALPKQ